jgi:hypothetical protein
MKRTMTHFGRARPARGGERGSVSSWLITGAFVMILGVGIAVDLTGQVHAQARANDIAFEAARAGAQQLDIEAAIVGDSANRIDAYQASVAVNRYLAATEVQGETRVRGDVVVVDTRTVYRTKFLSLIGLNQMPARGHGEARAVHAVGGAER